MKDEHHATLSLAAQWLSGLAAASFAAAALLNYIIFSCWGLNFLQIASTTDVISSGIEIFVRLIAPGIFFVVGWLAARIPIFHHVPAFILRMTVLVLIVVFEFAPLIYSNTVGDWTFFSLMISLSLFGFYQSYMVARGDVRAIEGLIVIGVFGIMIAIMGIDLVRQVVVYGFEPRRLILNSNEPCPGDVLWMGERAIVLRCPNEKIAVVYGPENASLLLRSGEVQPKIPSLPAKPKSPKFKAFLDRLRTITG